MPPPLGVGGGFDRRAECFSPGSVFTHWTDSCIRAGDTGEGLTLGPGDLCLVQGKTMPRDNASKGVWGQVTLTRELSESSAQVVFIAGSGCALRGLSHPRRWRPCTDPEACMEALHPASPRAQG